MTSFLKLSSFGIAITTYELDEDTHRYNPILTHIFWGKDFDEALGYAKSHLITDVFFSSSFVGELPWREDVLIMNNKGQYIGSAKAPTIEETLNILAHQAFNVYSQQESTGIIRTVQMISNS